MLLKVSGIQGGPFFGDYESNLEKCINLFEKAVKKNSPDIVIFSEMMTVPYFCGVKNDFYFSFGEKRDEKTISSFRSKAKELKAYVIITWFEKEIYGKGKQIRYFNSAGLISPKGDLVGVYRKTHIPKVDTKGLFTDEKYYFEPGDRLPIFKVKGIDIGILICYDRSFPEAWRTLWLKGAKIIFIPIATYGFREEFFIKELQVRAVENHVFVVAVNKAGDESIENETISRHHFGKSSVIDPFGTIMVQLDDEPFSIFNVTLDLEKVEEADRVLDWGKDRRPDLYGKISEKGREKG